jgi:hypothetical protein
VKVHGGCAKESETTQSSTSSCSESDSSESGSENSSSDGESETAETSTGYSDSYQTCQVPEIRLVDRPSRACASARTTSVRCDSPERSSDSDSSSDQRPHCQSECLGGSSSDSSSDQRSYP